MSASGRNSPQHLDVIMVDGDHAWSMVLVPCEASDGCLRCAVWSESACCARRGRSVPGRSAGPVFPRRFPTSPVTSPQSTIRLSNPTLVKQWRLEATRSNLWALALLLLLTVASQSELKTDSEPVDTPTTASPAVTVTTSEAPRPAFDWDFPLGVPTSGPDKEGPCHAQVRRL
jgi:hypothetical protein